MRTSRRASVVLVALCVALVSWASFAADPPKPSLVVVISVPGVAAGTYDIPVETVSIAKTLGALFRFDVGAADAALLEPLLGNAAPVVPKAVNE
jgi:hypothetical protein